MANTPKSVSGNLALSGTAAKHIVASKAVSGNLALSGSIAKQIAISKSVSGDLGLNGTAERKTARYRPVSGNLALSGGVNTVVYHATIPKSVSGLLSLSGAIVPVTKHIRALSGTLSLSGDVSRTSHRYKIVSGDLALVGGLSAGPSFTKRPGGSLDLSSSLSMDFGKVPSGGLSLSGTLLKNVSSSLSGGLFLDGEDVFRPSAVYLDGALALDGTLTKEISHNLEGSLGLDGTICTTGRAIQGELKFNDPPDYEGLLELSGELSMTVAQSKALSGELSFAGELDTGRIEGTLALSGTLTTNIHSLKAVDGEVALVGALLTTVNKLSAPSGGLTFMRVLKTSVTYYTSQGVSPLNLAASRDFVIEQGASFERSFRWMKSDGIPFDLVDFTISMKVNTVKGGANIIASSNDCINITKSAAEPGVFTISMSEAATESFRFIRAVYDIEASWGTSAVRLVEGNIVLSKAVVV